MITEQNLEKFSTQCKNIFEQIGRDVIGQKEVIEGAVIAMIAGGKWDDSNKFIDGNQYYRDYLEMYYQMAQEIFEETGEIPPELREFFGMYFGSI